MSRGGHRAVEVKKPSRSLCGELRHGGTGKEGERLATTGGEAVVRRVLVEERETKS